MEIDRILYPIHSLGPGERLVIWCIGCNKRCKHCSNPELWEANAKKNVEVKPFMDAIRKGLGGRTVDGVTITGGDPMEQFGELMELLKECANMTNDILLYTGYTYEECEEKFGKKAMFELKQRVGVFIDGRYDEDKNEKNCVLRGSYNQTIRYFHSGMRERYEEYMRRGRSVQNVIYKDRFISVGIHNP